MKNKIIIALAAAFAFVCAGAVAQEQEQAQIKALAGVAELVAQLREAQDAFAAAHDGYVRAKAGKGESASSLKKPLVSLINDNIVPYLSIVVAMDGYAEFIAAIAGNIKSTNDTVARRATAGKKRE